MALKIQTIKDTRHYLSSQLNGIYPEHEISALTNIIIKTTTGTKKLHYLAMQEMQITQSQSDKIIQICNELKLGKPLQYILGETDFFNCRIKLNNATLIPRPETEELVDLIIKDNKGFKGTILDIGTGSGCIAIALAVNFKDASLTGIDFSEKAIDIARENSRLNMVNVKFIKADLFSVDSTIFEKTDIIVSNPPYVRELEKKFMNINVLDHEPHEALFVPDSDALVYYHAILDLAVKILTTGGKIYFEINEAFGKEMSELLNRFRYSDISVVLDINNKERIIKGTKDV